MPGYFTYVEQFHPNRCPFGRWLVQRRNHSAQTSRSLKLVHRTGMGLCRQVYNARRMILGDEHEDERRYLEPDCAVVLRHPGDLDGADGVLVARDGSGQNSYGESFDSKCRDELLNMEVFHTVAEGRVLNSQGRQYYNDERPHSSLGYLTPREFTLLWRTHLPRACLMAALPPLPHISQMSPVGVS